MEKIQNNQQLDMFEGLMTHESFQLERLLILEGQQDKLRKGIFQRYNEQEKKIKKLSESVDHLINLLETEEVNVNIA